MGGRQHISYITLQTMKIKFHSAFRLHGYIPAQRED